LRRYNLEYALLTEGKGMVPADVENYDEIRAHIVGALEVRRCRLKR